MTKHYVSVCMHSGWNGPYFFSEAAVGSALKVNSMWSGPQPYCQVRFLTCYCGGVTGATADCLDFTWRSDVQQSGERLDRYENLFLFLSLWWFLSERCAGIRILAPCSCSVQSMMQFTLLQQLTVINYFKHTLACSSINNIKHFPSILWICQETPSYSSPSVMGHLVYGAQSAKNFIGKPDSVVSSQTWPSPDGRVMVNIRYG